MDSQPLLNNSDNYYDANGDDRMSNSQHWRPPTPPRGSQTAGAWSDRALNLMSSLGAGGSGAESASNVAGLRDVGIVADGTKYDESLLLQEVKPKSDGKSKRSEILGNIMPRRQQQVPNKNNSNINNGVGVYHHMGGGGGIDNNEAAERIRNQCSLFYDGADEEQQIRTNNNKTQLAPSSLRSSIHDAENPMGRSNSGRFDSITINAEDFSVSTLFRMDNEGQRQYRLPTDNVRLSVIPNVEPGILSMVVGDDSADASKSVVSSKSVVTSCSTVASEDTEDQSTFNDDKSTSGNVGKSESIWKSVNYVLSIDEFLYRRVVQEMADSLQSPYGCYNCCRDSSPDSGAVDIRVAVFILAVFFLFLFITTLVWPTQ